MTFKNENDISIKITGLPQVDVTASPYLPAMVESATHNYQLQNMPFYNIQVDYKQRGVGGNNSWGLKPLDKYRLLDDHYEYSILISPAE
jgi:beta-galactosidase